MNPKLPSRIMTVGVLALGISLAAKKFSFLSILGHLPLFEWGCGIVTAVAFTTGMFLSLYGLTGSKERRRTFFALHLIGLLVFCSTLTLYFLGYVVITRLDSEAASSDLLPQLIDYARNADSETTREKMAADAYRFYGATIAYRHDNGEVAYYVPTGADAAFRNQYEQDNGATSNFRQSLEEQRRQFPWLFSFCLGSFFVIYLGGTLWLLMRKPEISP
jgi:hypothetical protein